MDEKWDRRFLELAAHIARWSKDPSTKVGAVIVRPDKTICSLGYNGFARNMIDEEEKYQNRGLKYDRIIHAEMNALLHAKENVNGYVLYTSPFMPCSRCVVHMLQSGITRFVSVEPNEQQTIRWGMSFNQAKLYLDEAGAELKLYPLTNGGTL